MTRDIVRFHRTAWGGGQITVGHDLTDVIPWMNSEKLIATWDKGRLTIEKLN